MREADAHPARLHPAPPGRDGRPGPSLRGRQPWQAASTKDYGWLGQVITKHYHGDDSELPVLAAGILQAFADITVEDFEAQADTFLRGAQHPTLGRGYLACSYRPMVELLEYLEANGFANYIASGGGRDFMRPISQELYGTPPAGDRQQHLAGLRAGRARWYRPQARAGRPGRRSRQAGADLEPGRAAALLAAGNSNGDLPMLQFAERAGRPGLRLLVLHDDPAREFDYTTGAEQALQVARANGWTVVSINDDWATVF